MDGGMGDSVAAASETNFVDCCGGLDASWSTAGGAGARNAATIWFDGTKGVCADSPAETASSRRSV
jgi:hypothetical protein